MMRKFVKPGKRNTHDQAKPPLPLPKPLPSVPWRHTEPTLPPFIEKTSPFVPHWNVEGLPSCHLSSVLAAAAEAPPQCDEICSNMGVRARNLFSLVPTLFPECRPSVASLKKCRRGDGAIHFGYTPQPSRGINCPLP